MPKLDDQHWWQRNDQNPADARFSVSHLTNNNNNLETLVSHGSCALQKQRKPSTLN